MNRSELLKAISEIPAEGNGVNVVFRPAVHFFQGETEVGWGQQVKEVKCWLATVQGRVSVSEKSGVLFATSGTLLHCDTFIQHDPPTAPMSYQLPIGTLVQAGISIVMRTGYSEVTATVGIIAEPPNDISQRDYACTTGKKQTHHAVVEMDNVVQLTPADAALVSRLRQEVVEHGEERVKRFLSLAN